MRTSILHHLLDPGIVAGKAQRLLDCSSGQRLTMKSMCCNGRMAPETPNDLFHSPKLSMAIALPLSLLIERFGNRGVLGLDQGLCRCLRVLADECDTCDVTNGLRPRENRPIPHLIGHDACAPILESSNAWQPQCPDSFYILQEFGIRNLS